MTAAQPDLDAIDPGADAVASRQRRRLRRCRRGIRRSRRRRHARWRRRASGRRPVPRGDRRRRLRIRGGLHGAAEGASVRTATNDRAARRNRVHGAQVHQVHRVPQVRHRRHLKHLQHLRHLQAPEAPGTQGTREAGAPAGAIDPERSERHGRWRGARRDAVGASRSRCRHPHRHDRAAAATFAETRKVVITKARPARTLDVRLAASTAACLAEARRRRSAAAEHAGHARQAGGIDRDTRSWIRVRPARR